MATVLRRELRGKGAEVTEFWQEYQETGSIESRNKLIEGYLWLAEVNARKMAAKMPKSIEFDDLEAAANFGLIQAVETFKPELNNQFETYAGPRIWGAMIDWLRELDWVPRLARSNAKLYQEVVEAMGLEREPTVKEIANYLNVNLEEAAGLKADAASIKTNRIYQAGHWVRGEDNRETSDGYDRGPPPFDQIPDPNSKTPLEEAIENEGIPPDLLIAGLPPDHKTVLILYYEAGFTMRKIGRLLGLSESRVSQIYIKAIDLLREKLEGG